MNISFIKNTAIVLIFCLLSGFVGYRVGTSDIKVKWQDYRPKLEVSNKLPPEDRAVDFSLFWQVWAELQQKYVDRTKLDSQKMIYGAITGMVAALDDPYTLFLPPKQNSEVKEQLNGSFEGIGAELGSKDKRTVVIAPIADSPAEKAGVKTGDWIIKVNGEDVGKLSLPEVVAKIRGPKGTTVSLNVLHEDAKAPIDIAIVRDRIILKSVEWKIVTSTASASLKPAIELKLLRFGDNTDPQWDKVVTQISDYLATSSGKVSGVILDVRNNPGGYLSGSVYVASEFMTSGVVVKQVNYDGSTQTYSVNRNGKLISVPLIIIVNQGTASAAEILSGALRVADRAKIVGVKSFGKGSVQSAEDLPNGAGLHVTVAKWLLANDVWINGKGLTPDYIIENDQADPTRDLQIDKAIQVLNGK